MTDPEKVTKLQAAERQLRMAIQLFFEEADPVAIQTLASAASTILHDLANHRGIVNLIRDSDIIRPERKQEWIQGLNLAPNFFKHADRDPEEVLEFHRGGVEWSLFEGVDLFGRLTQTQNAETRTFFAWFVLKYPYLITDEQVKAAVGPQGVHLTRPENLNLFLDVLRNNQSLERTGQWPPKVPGT